MSRASLYREDLAFIHDAGFGDYSRNSAPGLLRLIRHARIHRGLLVDLACGSGIWAAFATTKGFKVLGADRSPSMIQLARRAAPRARFHCASLHDFALPDCDVITCIGEGLNYLSPGERPVRKLVGLFRRVFKALRPGGLFIFDVLIREGHPMNYRTWREGNNWAVLVDVQEHSPQAVLTRNNVIFRKVQGHWRRAREVHRLQVYSRREILEPLHQTGFAVTIARAYGKFPLPSRRLAFIARKRKLIPK